MSWSVAYIGTPEKINGKLDDVSNALSGQSKDEFDEAKPHIQALVSQNVGGQVIHLEANGHASFSDGKKTYGTTSIKITNLFGELAL